MQIRRQFSHRGAVESGEIRAERELGSLEESGEEGWRVYGFAVRDFFANLALSKFHNDYGH